ncbi:MAG: hypothetical protein ACOYJG_12735 [Prevotella sp.]|jgi:hypothetical protein
MKRILLSFMLAFLLVEAHAQDYQWCVGLINSSPECSSPNQKAYLWIPERCVHLDAVIFSQKNMSEELLLRNKNFRQQLAELNFGIVWVAPAFDHSWLQEKGSGRIFESMMHDLASVSGYSELDSIPVIPLGHSAMATFPWNFAAFNPNRTLAIISYKGDAPRTNLCGYGGDNVEWGRTRNIDGIPSLMIEGEWEWMEGRVNPALAFRMKYPRSCVSFLCDVGHGHFDVSDEVVSYLCLFLRKTAAYCLDHGRIVRMNPEKGWLAARWNATEKHRPKPASYRDYRGDPHDAFWYFDKEMAMATEQYYAQSLGKQTQFVGYRLNSKLTGYNRKLHAGTIIHPMFQTDGVTFSLSALYTDSTRTKPTLSHGKYPIKIRVISGPVEQINDTTFKFARYRAVSNRKDVEELWFQAIGPADKKYKAAAQQLEAVVPRTNTEGLRQSISFASIQDVDSSVRSIPLSAVSDSGLPVGYYVDYGPAYVEGNKLIINKIPPRSKFPVKIRVVAYQYGVKGKYQSAPDVTREFQIIETQVKKKEPHSAPNKKP